MSTKILILEDKGTPSSNDCVPVWPTSQGDANFHYTKEQFEQAYHHSPDFVARAPGRVNIIGEHIDYNGFGVLPMALEQSVFVAGSNTAGRKELLGEDDNTSAPITLSAQSTSEGATPCEYHYDLQATIQNVSSKPELDSSPPFDATDRHWSQYVLCAFFGVLEELCQSDGRQWDWKPFTGRNISLLIHGTIPQGAGVSSSSALVVSSALAFLALFQQVQRVPKSKIAQLCARCERYIGTEGGGMDQAISVFGGGQYIQFQPTFQHQIIPLPPASAVSWVVCHSLEESHKRHDAATLFNKRVIECKIGCQWLVKVLQIQQDIPTLLWESARQSGKSLEAIEALVRDKIPVVCSKSELMSLFQGSKSTADINDSALARELGITRPAGMEVLKVADSFCIRDRLLHVLSETRRVQEFVTLCSAGSSGNVVALGNLMNQSHQSCSKLYDCSSAQVDCLQRVCIDAPGAVGSRMTGAGWGGCVISLVYARNLEDFCAHVRERYYASLPSNELAKKKETDYMFMTKPSRGSSLFDCNAV